MTDHEAREVRRVPREAPRAIAVDEAAIPLPWKTRALIRVGTWLLFALGATWRVRVYGRDALTGRKPDDPRVVIVFWHGSILSVAWAHRQPASALVSEHRDGELITRVIARLGIGTVRGSSSRGGARALLECGRVLRQEGNDILITPDGPRGPRHQFAPGALIVAYRAQTSVVPLSVHIDRAWRLRSWDQFEIPKPFARVTLLYGPAAPVSGADAREVSAQTDEFAARLNANQERARELASQS